MHGSVLLLLLGLKGNRQKIKNGPGSKVCKNIYSDNLRICLGKLIRYKVLTPKVSKSSSWYRLGGIPITIYRNATYPTSFSLFCLFNSSVEANIKFSRQLDLNHGPLVLEVTPMSLQLGLSYVLFNQTFNKSRRLLDQNLGPLWHRNHSANCATTARFSYSFNILFLGLIVLDAYRRKLTSTVTC